MSKLICFDCYGKFIGKLCRATFVAFLFQKLQLSRLLWPEYQYIPYQCTSKDID